MRVDLTRCTPAGVSYAVPVIGYWRVVTLPSGLRVKATSEQEITFFDVPRAYNGNEDVRG